MRGSQFQAPNVHAASNQNRHYAVHRERLGKIEQGSKTFVDTTKAMKDANEKINRTHVFYQNEKIRDLERDNLRMLKQFLDV